MARDLASFPFQIKPHVLMTALSQPIKISRGVFKVRLADGTTGTIGGDLQFRWLPSSAIEVAGTYEGPVLNLESTVVHVAIDMLGAEAPALIASMQTASSPSVIRLLLTTSIGNGNAIPIEQLRFHLVNFPEYIGAPIRCQTGNTSSISAGRLELESHGLRCLVDEMHEVRDLRRNAQRDAGYIISHTGEVRRLTGDLRPWDMNDLLAMLRLFFGFVRGAWAGPVFPQGFHNDEKIWEQLAAWIVDETLEVPTWCPQRSGIHLNDVFDGFIRKWCDGVWNGPLKIALGWYVASNSSRAPNETRIVMALVALELLAWVEIVEANHLCSRGQFRQLSAAGRLRLLFQHLRVPLDVPSHFTEIYTLLERGRRDIPGIIAHVRNALVHATENSRHLIHALTGAQLWEIGQLALQSIELCVLALCGYRGKYARRAWRGWKGEDEVLVPWA